MYLARKHSSVSGTFIYRDRGIVSHMEKKGGQRYWCTGTWILATGLPLADCWPWANSSTIKLEVYTGWTSEVPSSITFCDLHSLQLLKFCWQETDPDKIFHKTPIAGLRFSSRTLKPSTCKGRGPTTDESFPLWKGKCSKSFLRNTISAFLSSLHTWPWLGNPQGCTRLCETSWEM